MLKNKTNTVLILNVTTGKSGSKVFRNRKDNQVEKTFSYERDARAYELLVNGLKCSKAGKYLAANAEFDSAVKTCHKDSTLLREIFFHKSETLNKMKKYGDALSSLWEAEKRRCPSPILHLEYGRAYYGLEDYQMAAMHLDKLIGGGYGEKQAYFLLAKAHFKLSNFEDALKNYEKSGNKGMEESEIAFGKGNAHIGLLQFEKAIVEFNKAENCGCKYASLYVSRGYALLKSGKYNEAIGDFYIARKKEYKNTKQLESYIEEAKRQLMAIADY